MFVTKVELKNQKMIEDYNKDLKRYQHLFDKLHPCSLVEGNKIPELSSQEKDQLKKELKAIEQKWQ